MSKYIEDILVVSSAGLLGIWTAGGEDWITYWLFFTLGVASFALNNAFNTWVEE